MTRLFVALLTAALPAFAQYSPQYRACGQKAKTQAEMNACANDEAERTDKQLNETYRKVLSEAKQPEAIASIKAAEGAWVAYRDAYIKATYPAKDKLAEYGSIYPMEANLLRAKLTQQQVAALKDLLQAYSSDEHRVSRRADTKDGGSRPRN
jgi:uncharacterized protein YecT (DUF1311 family)